MTHLHELKISEAISLSLALLRVIKHKDNVDIELSFNDVPSSDVGRIMLAMQKFAGGQLREFEIKEFYGELEPAADVDTGYFTGDCSGPLS